MSRPRERSLLEGECVAVMWNDGYHLVWVAGLFDYFNDRLFKLMLGRLLNCVAAGGELVIGNYSVTTPRSNLCWLRFVDWKLHYRTGDELADLALGLGI